MSLHVCATLLSFYECVQANDNSNYPVWKFGAPERTKGGASVGGRSDVFRPLMQWHQYFRTICTGASALSHLSCGCAELRVCIYGELVEIILGLESSTAVGRRRLSGGRSTATVRPDQARPDQPEPQSGRRLWVCRVHTLARS